MNAAPAATFKQLWKQFLPGQDIIIDNYEWVNLGDPGAEDLFRKKINEDKNIGIVSEAGCPGVADPGQTLIAIAQAMNTPGKTTGRTELHTPRPDGQRHERTTI
jgi:hypothetical protein